MSSNNLTAIQLDPTTQTTKPAQPDSAAPQKRRSIFQQPGVLFLLALFAVAGIFYGARQLQHAYAQESTDDAFVDAHIVSIAPKISGRIGKVPIVDNELVKKGDLLFEIDPADYESVVAQRQAAVQAAVAKEMSAQASMEQSRAHVRTLEAGYAAAKAIMDSADATAKRQHGDLQRNQKLAATGAISVQDFEHSSEDSISANANLVSKTKELEATAAYREEAQTQVDAAVAQVSAAKAEVGKAKAELAQAELQLSYTKVTAPETGRVTNKAVEPGIYVQAGQAMFALVPEEVWITANFKETQITHMSPGQPVSVRVDAYPDKLFNAHVDSLQAGSGSRFSLMPPENATGNYVKVVQRVPVKIVFDEAIDSKYALGPGMSAIPAVKVQVGSEARIVIVILEGMALLAVLAGTVVLVKRNRKS